MSHDALRKLAPLQQLIGSRSQRPRCVGIPEW
jgi:hypothetical protein